GDNAVASTGVNGTTGRHSMRLVNARFGNEMKFFWDERAANLEAQTTFPIQDHNEMGFSGTNGDGTLQDLIAKLQNIKYYQEMFKF
ncbi:cytochrome-c peroxidase, partial [Acinetobacter baumannii]